MVVQQARRVTPEEHNDLLLDVWREQVNQARRGQEASWSLAQGLAQQSADAYEDFLDSIFFYYGEYARAAEKVTREG
jgi:malate synthase